MLFLRALFFSLAILWRYILVFPFVVFGLVFFMAIALFFSIGLGMLSAPLGILVGVSFAIASTVMPTMVGTRLGLTAQGIKARNSYVALMLPALGYGIFEAFCVLGLFVLSIGVVIWITPWTFDAALALDLDTIEQTYARLMAEHEVVMISVTLAWAFLVVALRAALMVPFAGASVNADPNNRAHTPFFGFGTAFFTIFLFVALSYIGSSLVVPATIYLSLEIGFGQSVLANAASLDISGVDDILAFGMDGVKFVALIVVLYIWMISLPCAGAALAFMQYKARADLRKEQEYALLDGRYVPPEEDVSMMELVRHRLSRRDDDDDDVLP